MTILLGLAIACALASCQKAPSGQDARPPTTAPQATTLTHVMPPPQDTGGLGSSLEGAGSLFQGYLASQDGERGMLDAVYVQGDGKVLVGAFYQGRGSTYRGMVGRLDADGRLDPGFRPSGSGPDSPVYAFAEQEDGKIIVGGSFTRYDEADRPRIARLNADGSLDLGFGGDGVGFNNTVRACVALDDGKILVGGDFDRYGDVSRRGLARLNADGSLDEGFSAAMAAGDKVHAIRVLQDGRILVGGMLNQNDYLGVVRLNADGSPDASFATDKAASGLVYAIALQADGKIVLGGSFSNFDGRHTKASVARLGPDGGTDGSFTPGMGDGYDIYAFAVASKRDGTTLVGGNFRGYEGRTCGYITKLRADGTVDGDFVDVREGASDQVLSIAALPDGGAYVAGYFTSFDGSPRDCIVRLKDDGSLDDTFVPGRSAE